MHDVLCPSGIDPARLARIRWLVFDIDGVMTDGTLYYSAEGDVMKAFHVHDGQGVRLWMDAGRHTAAITGRASQMLSQRMNELGITHVYQDVQDKAAVFASFLAETGTDPADVCYIGDDVVDVPIFRRVGFGVAVADAVVDVCKVATWVTTRPGGRGAVRETIDLLLHVQDAWAGVTDKYFTV